MSQYTRSQLGVLCGFSPGVIDTYVSTGLIGKPEIVMSTMSGGKMVQEQFFNDSHLRDMRRIGLFLKQGLSLEEIRSRMRSVRASDPKSLADPTRDHVRSWAKLNIFKALSRMRPHFDSDEMVDLILECASDIEDPESKLLDADDEVPF